MYAAIWRRLPGGLLTKAISALALAAAVVVVLFGWVFPAVSPHLPFEDVTVQAPSTGTPSTTPSTTQK
ncbi:MAG: hypothetical protein HOQ21_05560 [Dermatophilaceae bacterium]|nr:hypothetical protein [Dermatophilaceae bacterium]